ncbi:hypothetical protein DFP94_10942 [Fontibacillus phaseoli]|uniref:Uncharacterized protein n=1 Tax=Fontibacillus phaseoli TaxID=1416533 RepID=A0A369B725_9BACL|nr:hypothetical protein DFP94_10942 [Fontibacillus phaseoli]
MVYRSFGKLRGFLHSKKPQRYDPLRSMIALHGHSIIPLSDYAYEVSCRIRVARVTPPQHVLQNMLRIHPLPFVSAVLPGTPGIRFPRFPAIREIQRIKNLKSKSEYYACSHFL